MAYEYFELPSSNGTSSDVVLMDPQQGALKAFVHYAYAVAGLDLDNVRGIEGGRLRSWHSQGAHTALNRIKNNQFYCHRTLVQNYAL